MKSLFSTLVLACALSLSLSAQVVLFGPEPFDFNFLYSGSNPSTSVWFAPSSQTPISFSSTGGCPDGRIGYSGSWNSYWGNFVRMPQVDCSNHDTITLSFDVSNSYFQNQPNDWCRFYTWADNGYKHNVINILIDGINVTYNAGANGKGFKFSEARNCAKVEISFDLSTISNKTNILLYLEPSCGYNNSNTFQVYFDNLQVTANGSTVGLEHQNQNHVNPILVQQDNDNLQLHFQGSINNLSLMEIYNSQGGKIYSSTTIEDGKLINVSSFSPGIYFIRISGENNYSSVLKFIR